VENALLHLKADFVVSRAISVLERTDKLIFPGVGEAGAAMKSLKTYGLDTFLVDYRASGREILGICLGAQIVLDSSDETDLPCLGLVKGRARKFSSEEGLKIPHMGWNSLSLENAGSLFQGIPEGTSFYFVHSYYPDPAERDLWLTSTEYGRIFCSSFQDRNLYAVQFHPEKSGKWGLRLLENFVRRIGPDCTKKGVS
jgi:glutamine amidotransferase